MCSGHYLCGCQVSCAPLLLKYGELWGLGSVSILLWQWVCSLEPELSAQLETRMQNLEMNRTSIIRMTASVLDLTGESL